jgi:hypothetical protein
MLAYYHYPFVDNRNYREYTEADLSDSGTVEELFDYCQILEASITKKGWAFLIAHYGYEKLFEIDSISGWHLDDTLEEYIASVQYEIEIAAEE